MNITALEMSRQEVEGPSQGHLWLQSVLMGHMGPGVNHKC